jgi:uncharacterized membrane protein
MTKGFVIPAGTVILIFSASHLARTGTESYAAEFEMAKQKLSKLMGGGIVLLHGFPVLYNSTENMALARSILDLEHWFGVVHKGRDIAGVRKHALISPLGQISHTSVPVLYVVRLRRHKLAKRSVRLRRRHCTL